MASPVIADPFHRMKYMERHGSGLRKIVRETEKPPGYTAAYNPKIFSTATDFRVILKNVNYHHGPSIIETTHDKTYDATHDTTHDNLEDDTHQGIHQDSHHDSTPSAVILRLMLFRFFSQS